jgi:hypothetical protein
MRNIRSAVSLSFTHIFPNHKVSLKIICVTLDKEKRVLIDESDVKKWEGICNAHGKSTKSQSGRCHFLDLHLTSVDQKLQFQCDAHPQRGTVSSG